MTFEILPADEDRRPDSPAHRIDVLCDRFQSAWQGGLTPQIETFVDNPDFTMRCLATASSSAFTLRCLRYLLFKDCLHRGGQVI
jgi:hypothetical protein